MIQRVIRVGNEARCYVNRFGHKARIPTHMINMEAPIQALVQRLIDRGIVVTSQAKITPKSISMLTNLPVKDIVLHYRAILMGFLNYYSFADNRPNLSYIY